MTSFAFSTGGFTPHITAPTLTDALSTLPARLRGRIDGGEKDGDPIAPDELSSALAGLSPASFRETAIWAEITKALRRSACFHELDQQTAIAIGLIRAELLQVEIGPAVKALMELKSTVEDHLKTLSNID
jgi:hypothetical protein